jgi:indolepyruvate ferredoxin oxidoreductase
MAYKDEYEVARLYADPSFAELVRREVGGENLRLTVHLSPPLPARRDPNTGRPRKMTFGPWMFGVFRGLARLKFLRGTALDPFGWTQERRIERRLIEDYRALLDEVLTRLTPENHHLAVGLAVLPEKIRGFGFIKLRNLDAAKADEAALLEQFRAGGAPLLKAAE